MTCQPVCKRKHFHNDSLKHLGPVQANLKVYKATNMNMIGFGVLYHHVDKSTHTLTLNITDVEDLHQDW